MGSAESPPCFHFPYPSDLVFSPPPSSQICFTCDFSLSLFLSKVDALARLASFSIFLLEFFPLCYWGVFFLFPSFRLNRIRRVHRWSPQPTIRICCPSSPFVWIYLLFVNLDLINFVPRVPLALLAIEICSWVCVFNWVYYVLLAGDFSLSPKLTTVSEVRCSKHWNIFARCILLWWLR
jgi:hypothetical protein